VRDRRKENIVESGNAHLRRAPCLMRRNLHRTAEKSAPPETVLFRRRREQCEKVVD
jgi:hypothetical protein